MPQYLGFSTKNACRPKTTNMTYGSAGGPGGIRQPIVFGKKYRLTDVELVIQDFLNALNIQPGTKVGQPGYGCKIWNYLFDPNIADIQFLVRDEITKIANADPRIDLNFVKTYPFENGILVEVEFVVQPFQQPEVLKVAFNSATNTAALA